MRTPEEAVKEKQEELSEASSIRSSDKSVEREEAQKQKSLMRRLYDSMFEEVEVDIPQSRQVSVATEESQASSSSLPMNVKKPYEPSSSSSSSRRSSGRSALLPVEEGALSEYVQSSPRKQFKVQCPLIEQLNIYKVHHLLALLVLKGLLNILDRVVVQQDREKHI